MLEKLVSLATAKLAKEKGFNLSSPAFYGCDDPCGNTESNKLIIRDWIRWDELGTEDSQEGTAIYSAPTQAMLQTWLRKAYDIQVYAYSSTMKNDMYADYVAYMNQTQLNDARDEEYQTYEEALEFALLTALKLI